MSQLRDGERGGPGATRFGALVAGGRRRWRPPRRAPSLGALENDRAEAIAAACVQEIITNAVRHARARNLWIAIADGPDGVALHARDDGRGAARLTWGNGLRGHARALRGAGGPRRRRDARRRPRLRGARRACRARGERLVDDPRRARRRPDAGAPGHPVAARLAPRHRRRRRSGRRRGGPRRDRAASARTSCCSTCACRSKNGLDVLRALQAAAALPPTILLTTFDDDEVLLEAVKAGRAGISAEGRVARAAHRGHPHAWPRGGTVHPPGRDRARPARPGARAPRLRRADPARPADRRARSRSCG